MIFDGCHFEYGSFKSQDYDLVFAHLDTSPDTRTSGEIASNYIFNKKNLKRYIIGNNYANSPISIETEIVRMNARFLEPYEKRAIEKALFNRSGFRKLCIDITDDIYNETYSFIDGDCKRVYLNCRFVNPSKIEDGAGRVIGYKCTMECESLMFLLEPVTRTYAVGNINTSSTTTITVTVDTDLDEYIYPVVTIRMGSSGGDIIICNNSDDSARLTKFKSIGAKASVVLRGDINYVNGQYYEKFVDRNFIRLLDGNNAFTIIGNVESITFEYSARRML